MSIQGRVTSPLFRLVDQWCEIRIGEGHRKLRWVRSLALTSHELLVVKPHRVDLSLQVWFELELVLQHFLPRGARGVGISATNDLKEHGVSRRRKRPDYVQHVVVQQTQQGSACVSILQRAPLLVNDRCLATGCC
jgi:hypothetical protein